VSLNATLLLTHHYAVHLTRHITVNTGHLPVIQRSVTIFTRCSTDTYKSQKPI